MKAKKIFQNLHIVREAPLDMDFSKEYFVDPEAWHYLRERGIDVRLISFDKKRKTWAIYIWVEPEDLEKTIFRVKEFFGFDEVEAEKRIRIIPRFNVRWNPKTDKSEVYLWGYHLIVIFRNLP